jgi:tellurite methyltransferase
VAAFDDWAGYYERNEGRDPRELLLETLTAFDAPGTAVDVGCGNGIETVAMLERGWTVLATDREDDAIRRTRSRAAPYEDRLHTLASPMEELVPPPADLVWASFSLFFCDPDRFPDLWSRLVGAIPSGGRFAGELLGDRDTWAREDGLNAFRIEDARALFATFELERFDEEEEEGDPGPKWWHVYHVVARKR